MELLQVAVYIGVSFVLAFTVESMVEYILGEALAHVDPANKYAWLLRYIALCAGVGLTWYWKIDLVAGVAAIVAKLAGGTTQWPASTLGIIISGLVVGRGAVYLHDWLGKITKPQV